MADSLTFDLTVGEPDDLYRTLPGFAAPVVDVPTSPDPRGLALRSMSFDRSAKSFSFFEQHAEVFFLTVAFDLSGQPPLVLPAKEARPEDQVLHVQAGDTVSFNLGDGAPVFPPRQLTGGLIAYLLILETDEQARNIGETLGAVHDTLGSDATLSSVVARLAQPNLVIASVISDAIAAVLSPLTAILKANADERVAAFQGFFGATSDWSSKLLESRDGVTAVFRELS